MLEMEGFKAARWDFNNDNVIIVMNYGYKTAFHDSMRPIKQRTWEAGKP